MSGGRRTRILDRIAQNGSAQAAETPSESAPEEATPVTADIREAIDIQEVAPDDWRVSVVLYQGGACERHEVFQSPSGIEASARFMQLAVKKSIRGRTGAPHPDGERIL